MKSYTYIDAEQLRSALKNYKGVSGVYLIRFINKDRYVGKSIDLYERLCDHIRNMESGSPHNLHESQGIERFLFNAGFRYSIEIYECPIDELRLYEEYLNWEQGGFGKVSRESRNQKTPFPVFRPAAFNYITEWDWYWFLRSVESDDAAHSPVPYHLLKEEPRNE